MSWLPDRKVWASGLTGVVAWFIVYFAGHYFNLAIPSDVQAQIAGGLGLLVAYIVPPSTRDTITRLNDELVKIAAADPAIPVSERTLVLPEATKVVSTASPSPVVAVPPALGPPPVIKTPEAKKEIHK